MKMFPDGLLDVAEKHFSKEFQYNLVEDLYLVKKIFKAKTSTCRTVPLSQDSSSVNLPRITQIPEHFKNLNRNFNKRNW